MILHQRKAGAAAAVKLTVAAKQEAEKSLAAEHYDIIVVGLGTAGAIAAIAAAEKGLRVLGLERLNAMGGAGTIGAVVGYYFGSRGGLFESIDEETKRLEQAGYTPARGVNAETKKYALERRALDAGVAVRYESAVIGVYTEGEAVRGVRWIGPNGTEAASCRILIDASGDAEACAMAGVPMRGGRSIDGGSQPFSHPFVAIRNDAVHPFYTDSGYVDQTDAEDLTQAVMHSATLFTHLRGRYDETNKFLKLAPQLGVREGRFIEAKEQVTLANVLNDSLTDEPLFFAYSNLDNHGKDIAFESELQQDWAIASSLWGLNLSVPIPLGALLPQGLSNVLIAGRSLGIDHDLAACVRMKRDMQKCGEAAALTAYVAIREGLELRKLSYKSLLPLLLENGCLQAANNVGMKNGADPQDEGKNASVAWLTDILAIREGLAGEKPGIAIWSCRRLGAAAIPHLMKWLDEPDSEHLRRHSAFALALLGKEEAIPVLRECVRERDTFVPRTSRKYNQVRGYAAIYLLGKLRDASVVPELLAIVRGRNEFRNLSTDAEFINHEEEYFFQYFSFSLMALFRIAEHHPELRGVVLESVIPLVESPDFSVHVTLKPSKDVNFDMSDTVRRVVRIQAAAWDKDALSETTR